MYAGRALTKQECKYAITKKELLRQKRDKVSEDTPFVSIIDILLSKSTNVQYKIIYLPGKLQSNADALTRLPAFPEKCISLTSILPRE